VALWVTVGLSICIVVLLAVLAYICQKKIRQSCEEEENAGRASLDPAAGAGDGGTLPCMTLPWWWHLSKPAAAGVQLSRWLFPFAHG